ncbi:MAG: substrate-binding domain-containing protein, partial [Acidimicrobiales bacterium]
MLDAFQKALGVAAKRAGDKVIPLNAGLSVSKQVSDIQELITDKVDAIVVFPLAAQALVPALTHARKAGIKVVGYNAVTTETATSASLYPYNADINQGIIHQGAKQAAQFVAQQLHGKGNVLGVNISLSVPSLDAFIASEKQDVTSANPGIHWVGTAFDQTDDIAGADSS